MRSAGVLLVVAAGCTVGCENERGRVDIAVVWPAGVDLTAGPAFLTTSIRSPDANGEVLHSVGPSRFDRDLKIDLGDVVAGPTLVGRLDVTDGRWSNSQTLYRGLSAPFEIEANETKRITVEMKPLFEDGPAAATKSPDGSFIVHERARWGRLGGADESTELVEGQVGAVDPGATVLVFDDTNVAVAKELGRATADDAGAFSIPLTVPEGTTTSRVFVAAVDGDDRLTDADPAPGLQAQAVERIRVFARPASNGAFRAFTASRTNPTRVIAESAKRDIEGADLARLDRLGDAVEAVAKPYFESSSRSEGLVPRAHAAITASPTSGVVLQISGGGASPAPWSFDASATLTRGRWDDVDLPNAPTARRDPAMVYDSVRERFVLFGGRTDDELPLADTATLAWEGDLREWSRSVAPDGPSARYGHAMVFLVGRGVTMLIGGRTEDGAWSNEVWLFDDDWRDGPEGPPALVFPEAAYDLVRDVVVVHGTDVSGAPRTWEFSEVSGWHEPSSDGPAMIGHVLVYDPSEDRTVLYGGEDPQSGQPLDDRLWVWDGNTWTVVASFDTAVRPPLLSFAAGTYLPSEESVLVWGGAVLRSHRPGGYTNETWALRGNAWTIAATQHELGPSETAEHIASVSLPGRGRALMAAGNPDGPSVGTFGRVGRRWEGYVAAFGVMSPGSALGYLPLLGTAVHYGGQPDPMVENTRTHVLTFNGPDSRWVERTPTGNPGPRFDAAMVHHDALERLVLFGGTDDHEHGWTLDGLAAAWAPLVLTSTAPPPRYGARMVYDSNRDAALLYGGTAARGGEVLGDFWRLTSDAWLPMPATANGPGPRVGHGLAYDPLRDKVVLYGGSDGTVRHDDVWEWDGEDWFEIDVESPVPIGRDAHMFEFDPSCGCFTVYGGTEEGAGPSVGTWTFHHPPSLRPEVRFELHTDALDLRDAAVARLTLRVAFAGEGDGPTGATRGADLSLWNRRRAEWSSVATTAGALDDLELVEVSLERSVGDFVDVDGVVHIRLSPTNGDGAGTARSRVRVDAIEASLDAVHGR